MVSPASTTVAPPGAFLDRLHVQERGPEGAPAVLMLHGWASSAELMAPAGAPLEDRFRILNVDLPGHGRTPEPPAPWGVPEYAAVIDAFLESRDLTGIPVIGHSNGGRIALYMASEDRYRHRFSRLALIAPSGVEPQRPASYYLKTAWISTLKAPFSLLPPALRGRGLAWLRTTIYWKLVASSDYQQASGVMRETFVKTVRFHLDARLERISAPVLLLWGDRDEAVSRYQVEELQRRLPDGDLVVMEGAGHYAYLDDPVTYAAAVKHFLDVTVSTRA